ncbi:DUF3347 domain-containing protein [Salinimicrobium soli]|uniref:DUF3347 domain-containing protein n=1 Tax=Salinimicrobium soli TaxID=1254399 RepID=UPI003AACF75D
MKKEVRKGILFSLMAASLSLAACGDSKKENEADDASMPMQNEMHMEADEMQEMGDMDHGDLDKGDMAMAQDLEFKNEKMSPVYGHYNHVRMALVNSDAAEAQNGGKMLVAALQEANGSTEAMEAAQKIAQSDDLNVQRTAFSDLSNAMEGMMTGALSSGEVYKQFCPMAFEGKGGYWLSSSKEIRNPYYGDKMLKCGSVKDTIK